MYDGWNIHKIIYVKRYVVLDSYSELTDKTDGHMLVSKTLHTWGGLPGSNRCQWC